MKKIFLTLTSFLIIILVQAQTKVGLMGGYNYSSAKATYAGIKQPVSGKSGFGIGVMAKVPFDGLLHFTPSVGYNMRGFTISPLSGTNSRESYTIHYLDLIPSLSIDVPAGTNNSFAFSVGPVLGLTNFGDVKKTNRATGVTTEEKIKFGFGGFGWFDLGVSTGIGYHMRKTFIEARYMNGFSSINNNEETDQRNIKNRMLSLNVGYYLR